MRRAAGVIAGVALAGTLLAACGGGSHGAARLTADGDTEVAGANGAWHRAHTDRALPANAKIRVLSGSAQIRLVPGGLLELRPGSRVQLGSTPSLQAGDVLIEPDIQPVRVAAGLTTSVVASGAARLSAGPDAQLTVYRGAARLSGKSSSAADVSAPRQATVTADAGRPTATTPLTYHSDDQWDRRYLAKVEDFGRQLSDAATGFDAQVVPGTTEAAGFFQQLLPTLSSYPDYSSAFDTVASQRTVASRSAVAVASRTSTSQPRTPGGYLVASAIALRGQRGSIGQRLAQEFGFADQGADWGLVALDQGVTDFGLVGSDVLIAIGRAPLQFALAGTTEAAVTAVRTAAIANLLTPLSRATIRSLAAPDGTSGATATAPLTALLNLMATVPGPAAIALTGAVPTALTTPIAPAPALSALDPTTPSSGLSVGSTGDPLTVGPTSPSAGPALPAGGTVTTPGSGPATPSATPTGSPAAPAPNSGLLDPLLTPVLMSVNNVLKSVTSGLLGGLLPKQPTGPRTPAPTAPATPTTTTSGAPTPTTVPAAPTSTTAPAASTTTPTTATPGTTNAPAAPTTSAPTTSAPAGPATTVPAAPTTSGPASPAS